MARRSTFGRNFAGRIAARALRVMQAGAIGPYSVTHDEPTGRAGRRVGRGFGDWWRRPHWAWLGVVAAVLGCNRSGMDLAPAEGVVSYQGAPLANAGVMFLPQHGAMAIGVTDAEGRFTLTTANRPGALIGSHRVSISKDETTAIPQRRGFPLYKTKNYIPAKYGDPGLSGLTAEVKDDDNYFEFGLQAE